MIVNTCAVTAEAVRQARQAIRRARRESPRPRSSSPAARRRSIRTASPPWTRSITSSAIRRRLEAADLPGLGLRRQRAGHGQRHHVGDARPRAPSDRGLRHRKRAPMCRSRTAATIAAPSASFRSAAGRRARCRPARWWRRCGGSPRSGYAEIVLTGVDITAYGADLPGEMTLGRLVRKVLKLVPELRASALLDRFGRGRRRRCSRPSPRRSG